MHCPVHMSAMFKSIEKENVKSVVMVPQKPQVAGEVLHDERCVDRICERGPGGQRMGTTFRPRN